MAETNAPKIMDGANQTEENKTPDEKLTDSIVTEITATSGNGIKRYLKKTSTTICRNITLNVTLLS